MTEMSKNNICIENMIYEIRGKQVILDSDLAKLYKCKNGTKTINQAVNRHKERFPDDFYFELNENEFYSVCGPKLGPQNKNILKNRVYPKVFTEQGVAMLSTIIRTNVASEVSISIMRAFVFMRRYISNNLFEQKYINNQVMKNAENIRILQETLKKFEEKKIVNEIFFDGQIYDAYSKIFDILQIAEKEIVLIDGYADKTILDITKNLKVKVIIITNSNNNLFKIILKKYIKQYNNLKVIYNNSFHDRYFIIDKKTAYHCGTSINNAGSKTFSINLLEDELIKKNLIEKINNIIKEYV